MQVHTFTLQLAEAAPVHMYLSEPAQRQTCENMAKHQAALDHEAAELRKTYHLGSQPTPSRGYDDRLTVRLGMSRSTLMEKLELWRAYGGKRGGLRYTQGGNKYWVSERACRELMGDNISQAA